MKLISVEKVGKRKEYKAIFEKDNKKIIRRFGTKNNYVGLGNKTEKDRLNYISRHSKNPLEKEALKDPSTPASLSMGLLWGKSKNINNNIEKYKKKYKLK